MLKKKREKKKLFPSAEPKAALLMQKLLFSVLKNKGAGAGMQGHLCLPSGKENYSNSFFTVCTEHAVSQRHRYKTHNNLI